MKNRLIFADFGNEKFRHILDKFSMLTNQGISHWDLGCEQKADTVTCILGEVVKFNLFSV